MWRAETPVYQDPAYTPFPVMQGFSGQQWIPPQGHYPVDHGPGTPYATSHPQRTPALFFAPPHQIQHSAHAMPRAAANAGPMHMSAPAVDAFSQMTYFDGADLTGAQYPQGPTQPYINPGNYAYWNGHGSSAKARAEADVRRTAGSFAYPPRQVPNLSTPQQRARSPSPGYVPDTEKDFPTLGGPPSSPDASLKRKKEFNAPSGSKVPQRIRNAANAARATDQPGVAPGTVQGNSQINDLPPLNLHILDLHVAKTDVELADRQGKRGPLICSSFFNREEAEGALNRIVSENLTAINDWKIDKNRPLRLAVTTLNKADHDIGKAKCKSDGILRPVRSATAILHRNASAPLGFAVVTLYPSWP